MSNIAAEPIGGKIMTRPFKIFLGLAMIGALLILIRFFFGLGAVSNLSDGYPWGMWIVYDVVTGTAIACGGYAMALLIYVFNKFEYHSLIRSALMTGMFGYTLAAVSIVVDVGRYWNLHYIFLNHNFNSIMFEVALCVSLYIMVMYIEFSPTFFEARKNEKMMKIVNKVMFVFIAIGILLPTMHQSSLGTLMIIAGHKLHALWQTPMLPLLFLISAIFMGFAIVVVESNLSASAFNRPLEMPLLSKLGKLLSQMLLVYLILRFGDIIWRGAVMDLFMPTWSALAFWIENILLIIPMVWLFNGAKRNSVKYLSIAAGLIVVAGAVYRFNAFLTGFNPGPEWYYFPTVSEIMITVGIISAEIVAYLIFVKRLPVLPKAAHTAK